MANNTSILINVGAATAAAVRNLGRVNTALEDQKKHAKAAQSPMRNFAKIGLAAVATAGIAAAAGLVQVGQALLEMGKEAWEDEQTVRKMERTLGRVPGVTQKMIDKNNDWVDSMQMATLVADTDLRKAVSNLAVTTGDLGLAQQGAAAAADLAAGRNISFERALKIVTQAAAGHTAQLEKMIPGLDANKDGTVSFTEALGGLEKAYGGAAKAAADNDVWGRIRVIFDELRESIGQFLLPILDELAKWFKDPKNRQKVQEFTNKVGELSKMVGTTVVNSIKRFITWLNSPEGKQAMKDFKGAIDKIWKALEKTWGWLNDNKVAVKFFVAAFKVQIQQLENTANIISGIANALENLWGWLKRIKDMGGIHLPRIPSIPGLGSVQAGPTVAGRGLAPATTSTVVINWYGGSAADARVVKRILEADDVRQGRPRGAKLAVAW